MTSPYWAKLWIEILDDPKVATMPDWLFRRFIFFVLAAKEYDHDGLLQPVSDLAWRLRIDSDACTEALEALLKIGVTRETADGWILVNFTKRQYNDSAERVRRWRDKKRNGCNAPYVTTETEEEEDKESDIDKNKNIDDGEIFKLFQDNICFLTPMLAEKIKDAIDEYGQSWVKDAIKVAVDNNARNMKYIEAVLRNRKNGKSPGKMKRGDHGETAESRRKYAEWETTQ